MSLAKWEPFNNLANLQQSINRLFEETLPSPRRAGVLGTWSFPVDVKETPENIIIKAEIPGVDKDDIKVHFVNNELSIHGERKHEEREENTRFHRVERSYGSFYRSIHINTPIKEEGIRASYRDGMLEISLPKKEEAIPREIPIERTGRYEQH